MPVTLRHLIVLGVVACVVTILAMPYAKRAAKRFNAIDYPDARRVNTKPIARLGGIAMFAGILGALLVELIGETFFDWAGFYTGGVRTDVNHWGVMIGVMVVFATGVVDDVKHIRPLTKLAGQIIGALIIATSGVLFDSLMSPFGGGMIHIAWWLAYPLTVFYLVAFMNVINLIDGLDGLAGGITAIGSAWLFVIAFQNGLVETAMLSIVLLGACLGFLKFNFHPASIFMGDSGSLTLGAMLGVISLLGVMKTPTLVIMAVPLIIVAIPIADTACAIIRRIARHQSIMQPDKGHLHHRLLGRGYSMRTSVIIIYVWTFVLGFGAFLMSNAHGFGVIVVFALLLTISFGILWWTGMFEPVLRHHYHERPKDEGSDRAEGE